MTPAANPEVSRAHNPDDDDAPANAVGADAEVWKVAVKKGGGGGGGKNRFKIDDDDDWENDHSGIWRGNENISSAIFSD